MSETWKPDHELDRERQKNVENVTEVARSKSKERDKKEAD